MWLQCLWMVLTLGFYSVYWFYQTSKEMVSLLKRNDDVGLWTVLMFIPFAQFYSMYKQGELYEQLTDKVDRWIVLLLWVFFQPAVWFIIQRKLNELARAAPRSEVSLA
jgi:hypothetical protein